MILCCTSLKLVIPISNLIAIHNYINPIARMHAVALAVRRCFPVVPDEVPAGLVTLVRVAAVLLVLLVIFVLVVASIACNSVSKADNPLDKYPPEPACTAQAWASRPNSRSDSVFERTVYFVLSTIETVGYGDVTVLNAPAEVRNIILLLNICVLFAINLVGEFVNKFIARMLWSLCHVLGLAALYKRLAAVISSASTGGDNCFGNCWRCCAHLCFLCTCLICTLHSTNNIRLPAFDDDQHDVHAQVPHDVDAAAAPSVPHRQFIERAAAGLRSAVDAAALGAGAMILPPMTVPRSSGDVAAPIGDAEDAGASSADGHAAAAAAAADSDSCAPHGHSSHHYESVSASSSASLTSSDSEPSVSLSMH